MSGDGPRQRIHLSLPFPLIPQSFQYDGVIHLCGHTLARILLTNITDKHQGRFPVGAIGAPLEMAPVLSNRCLWLPSKQW